MVQRVALHSCLVPSVPEIGSGSRATLTRIKWVVKIHELMYACLTEESVIHVSHKHVFDVIQQLPLGFHYKGDSINEVSMY